MAGRPTDYKDDYPRQLIEHMAQGFSYAAFAGRIGVAVATLYNWEKDNPAFLEAKSVGAASCQLFWESIGIAASKGLIEGFSASAWIFNMKNRFGWRDQKPDDIDNKSGPTTLKYPTPRKVAG